MSPTEIDEMCLQLTNMCPLRCMHCSTRGGARAPSEMSDSDIQRLISDFAMIGGKVVELSGGEPLVHPSLDAFVATAAGLALEVRLYSSGVVAFKDGAAAPPSASRWTELHRAGLSKVFFNLQAEIGTLHDFITRIPGSYVSVLESIRFAKQAGLYVGVHFVPMAPNFNHIEETYRLASSLAVDEFAVLRLVLQGRAADNRTSLALTQGEHFEVLRRALRLEKATGNVRVRLGCPFNHRLILEPGSMAPSCRAGEAVCHVRPNGDIVPCSGLQHGGIVLGNVRFSSLAREWQSNRAWSAFRDARSQGPVPGSAEFIHLKGDPCLAQLAATGSPGKPQLRASYEASEEETDELLTGPQPREPAKRPLAVIVAR